VLYCANETSESCAIALKVVIKMHYFFFKSHKVNPNVSVSRLIRCEARNRWAFAERDLNRQP
jgi:hypothetical protein